MSATAQTNARQILDSRGYRTVEVEVTLDSAHNRLLRIEDALGSDATFAGLSAFYPDRREASA